MVNGYRRNTAALPLFSSSRARLGKQGASGQRFASTTRTLDIELALKLAIGRNFRKSVAVT